MMNKAFLIILLLTIIFAPFLANAEDCGGIVGCPTGENGTYSINDFFAMLGRIFDFIVKKIATPLAVLAITIGGILMLISAGNPNLFGLGKTILFAAIIGLVLTLGSWLIINTILTILGYRGKLGDI